MAKISMEFILEETQLNMITINMIGTGFKMIVTISSYVPQIDNKLSDN